MLETRCEECHTAKVGQTAVPSTAAARLHWLGATEGACETCHRVPDHHASEIGTPECAQCHVEHQGMAHLDAVKVPRCTGCHADLPDHMRGTTTLVGQAGLRIDDFAHHPEFAVWIGTPDAPHRVRLDAVPPPRDPTGLRFNHAKHLNPIGGPPAGHPRNDAQGKVQMVCGDCHAGSMTPVRWEFGTQAPGWTPVTVGELAPAEEVTYMAPVRYAQQCAACHPHNFADPRFPDLLAPHDRPVVIRAFLRGLYERWIVEHPTELAGPPLRRPVGEGARTRSAETAWVNAHVAAAEKELFREPKRCRLCHTLDDGPDGLPVLAPTRVPVRWLPQSRFDHGTHRLLSCTECHAARTSESETDVLIPRREVCAKCHHPEGAADACAECHTYHGAVTAVAMDGTLKIAPLAGGR
ncbi:MAG TPA: hypothetical protein VGR62_24975 [Candidatus Binatia bacterium]|nr:hypothetical protein [Candidatus Binatia bacterium]